jgi:Reverse transcriptase (RNA-dependent DNA polymerase)
MVIMLWIGYIMDVNGAFLLGNIEKGKELYMKIPQGFEKFYVEDDVWLLLKTLYGTKQAAKHFGQYYCILLKQLVSNVVVLSHVYIISGIMVC